jgi:hypothetical protein
MLKIALFCAGLALASESKESATKNYTIDTSGTSQQVQPGKQGTLRLHIKAAEGYKVSPEAPLKIALTGDGVDLTKTKLGHDDAKDKKSEAPEFNVAFSSASAGDKKIVVDASFFVCNEKICERKTEKLSVPVSVRP